MHAAFGPLQPLQLSTIEPAQHPQVLSRPPSTHHGSIACSRPLELYNVRRIRDRVQDGLQVALRAVDGGLAYWWEVQDAWLRQ
ncbi:unnamed protein product [Alternaria burnsii]|nr:unnamed protein product [Alternaria burnsii]